MAQIFWQSRGPFPPQTILPADRLTTWQPGVTYNKIPASGAAGNTTPSSYSQAGYGIPNRTTIYTTLSPIGGGSDDSAQIQTAVNNCPAGQVVLLSSGNFTFTLGNFVLVPSYVTVRGAGAGSTIITKSDGTTFPGGGPGHGDGAPGPNPGSAFVIGPAQFGIVPGDKDSTTSVTSSSLTADAAHGAYSITVANAAGPGFAVGMIVLLDEASGAALQTDPVSGDAAGGLQIWASPDYRVAWKKHVPTSVYDDFGNGIFPNQAGTFGDQFSRLDRPSCEVKEIASVVGNTVTFTSPVHLSYRVSRTAQLTRWGDDNAPTYPYHAHVIGSGVESMSFVGFDNAGAVRMTWAAYCWVKGIDNYQWIGSTVYIYSCFRCEVRDFYSHGCTAVETGGGGYALLLDGGSSEILIENGISIECNKVTAMRAAGAGSVVAYCYLDKGYLGINSAWVEIGANGSHLVGPHHVLFEGNYSFNGDSDNTHGNSIYHTFFRNHLSGFRETFVRVSDGVTVTDPNVPGGNGPLRCGGLGSLSYWFSFVGNVLGVSGQMGPWAYSTQNYTAGPAIWMLGVDNDYTQVPSLDNKILDNSFPGHVIRDGNWDWLQSTQSWHNTPTKFTIPSSLYLTGAPTFWAGSAHATTWPWVDPSNGTTYVLPAKARYDAGQPNNIGY